MLFLAGALLSLFVLHGAGNPDEARLDSERAVEAYRSGDFEGAISHWMLVLEQDKAARVLHANERARVLYNVGNSAFRQERLHEAVGWYTAALRYRPRDADTWTNLEFARSEAGLDPADRGDLSATIHRLLSSLTLAESEWLVLLALGIFLIPLVGEALRGGLLWRRLALCGLALVLISLVPWLSHLNRVDDPVLVIRPKGVSVYSEPRPGATEVSRLDAGLIVEKVDSLPDWIEVRVPDGFEGWVSRDSVFPLRR